MAGDKLSEYRSKRDFDATPEPAGGGDHDGERERFVVQEHHARNLHWDLRLERDGVLVSWALPKGIPTNPKRNHLAVHVEDHPLDYIDFAGEIPAGEYGAGKVEDLGLGHVRDAQVPRRRGDGHLPRRAPGGQVRPVPDARARTG